MNSCYYSRICCFLLLSIYLLVITYCNDIPKKNLYIQHDINFNRDWEIMDLDDRNPNSWKKIQLPHDFSIAKTFDPVLESESAFLPGGTVYYQKKFKCPKEIKDLTKIINFEGVYSDAYVFVNYEYLGENHYGYNPFAFDITNYLKCDNITENLIEVKVENNMPTTRYYSGSGIYRDVTLSIISKVHIAYNGIYVQTPGISKGDGTIKIKIEVNNNENTVKDVVVESLVVDQFGVEHSIKSKEIPISTQQNFTFENVIVLENPILWSLENPYLYKLITKVHVKDEIVDEYTTTFGFRYFEFNTKHGFELNGVPTKIHGVCMHHDQGGLGAASYYDSNYRQIKIMKDMGMNSIRTSHNIPDKKVVSICEELGMLIDEEAFDGWKLSKHHNPNDFGKYFKIHLHPSNKALYADPSQTWAEYSLKAMIRRDRNSPAIILWSLGNEIDTWTQTQPPARVLDSEYPELAQKLIDWTKSMDLTRPVTLGDNGWTTKNGSDPRMGDKWKAPTTQKIFENGGVMGYNYGSRTHVKNGLTDWGILYHSESVSSMNSRGVYNTIKEGSEEDTDGHYHLTSYDESEGLSETHHEYLYRIWYFDDINGGLAGQYIWTGFDYLGEPAPWNAPFRSGTYYKKDYYNKTKDMGPYPNSAYFGLVDTAGFPKDTFYLYRSQAKTDSITLHLVNGWDKNNIYFISKESDLTLVAIYSNANIVKLYRNDTHIGTATRTNVTTLAGYKYFTYSVVSHVEEDICKAVEPSKEDGGTSLYARFNVKFDENVNLYIKAFENESSTEEIKDTIGTSRLDPMKDEKYILVKSDKNTLKVGGYNLAFVEVELRDKNDISGNLKTYYNDQIKLTCTLEGEGKILAVDNGDQSSIEKYQQKSVLPNEKLAYIQTYAGKALFIITSTDTKGNITLSISSDGLETKTITINTI